MGLIQDQISLSPQECAAIRALAKDLEDHAKTTPVGKAQPVDFMLHIQGNVSKEADGTTTRTNKPDATLVLAWVMSRMSADAQSKLLDQWAAELKTAKNDVKALEVKDAAAKNAALMIQAASTTSTSERSGALKGSIKVSSVEMSKLSKQVQTRLKDVSRVLELTD